ncbi:hypothetical protein F7725_026795 [Dissostichus mawsoni]|uniref:THAP domain-containing protein 1 n=1 Tax=Dissostichus mawsoni TaxID=36200 RepID=A0A7J5X808_DISMA|nr:hypothetical protein F7725_026795 [Dissostichus mawsoni]
MSVRRKIFKTEHMQRQTRKYSEHCCVPLCSASAKCNGVLSFHGFPIQLNLRRQWLVNIRRENFTITSHSKVCSRHFAPDQLINPTTLDGRRRLVKDALPMLFEWNSFTLKIPRPDVWERRERPIEPDPPEEHEQPCDLTDHDYCSVPEPSALDMSYSATEDQRNRGSQKEIAGVACPARVRVTEVCWLGRHVRFYTRFSSYDNLWLSGF